MLKKDIPPTPHAFIQNKVAVFILDFS
ncbi:hypothetical protein EVA_07711, partial [gut metagenome]